ncbi:hypothetical protein CTEN210_11863 [Chaetoceros tenuissimus]|uniref:Methyltransferase domain-containing protein n=1 Tax=Chaetoceros tenuissimus TaxID=426638 RepID=A0AAD3D0I9_9STRA|nr:hypothetical protein CTEN210_11863 [Chaetoceros tenuissimus]
MRSNYEPESSSMNNYDDEVLSEDSSVRNSFSASRPNSSHTTSTTTVSKRTRIRNAMIQFAKQEFTKDKHDTTQIEKVAPISPTPLKLLHHVMPHLNLHKNSRIIELGCGDARWLTHLCQTFNCQGIGVDIDSERLALARRNISQLENKIVIKEEDIFDFLHSIMLNEKDVLVMYLFREAMIRIASILNEKGWKCAFELSEEKKKSGESLQHDVDHFDIMQIVCIGFTLPGLKPIWSSQVEGIRCYIYHCRK